MIDHYNANTIHTTYDYNNFKYIKFNRPISPKNLSKLIELNKERDRFHLFPIVIDQDYNIIDGQHRYEACKQLNKPIHYLIDRSEEDKWKAITEVNTAGKKHNAEDLFYMLLNDKDPVVLELNKVVMSYPEENIGKICSYFIGSGNQKNGGTRSLMQKKIHKLHNFELKLSVFEAFLREYNYFKPSHLVSLVAIIKRIEIEKEEVSSYLAKLKTKGFVPHANWGTVIFKEQLIKFHDKGRHANRLGL